MRIVLPEVYTRFVLRDSATIPQGRRISSLRLIILIIFVKLPDKTKMAVQIQPCTVGQDGITLGVQDHHPLTHRDFYHFFDLNSLILLLCRGSETITNI